MEPRSEPRPPAPVLTPPPAAGGALREGEPVHREMVQRSPNPVFLVDAASGRVIEANPAAAAMLACDLAALLGREFHTIDARGHAGAARIIDEAAERHHPVFGETELCRADGSLVPVELSGNPLSADGGRVVCLFVRDVSDRKAAEEKRFRLERQLWYSQKHEAVGRLAGGIAHDFNNLLMAIMLNVDLVHDQLPESHPARDELQEILEASRRARDLTRQLLAFSGRQVLKPRAVRLNQVVAAMERLVRRTIGEDVHLVVDLAENAGVVHVDAGQMEQVVLNLIVNARDAMPEGGELCVSTRNVELDDAFCRSHPSARPGPHVALAVRDSGQGMDPETLVRVFEPFFTTKDQGKGTGLGLATVYGIVKQSGGNIWVESVPGAGSTFEVHLPRLPDGAEDGPTRTDPAPSLDSFRGTELVLVVEDEDSVRSLVAGILKEQGYAVLQAGAPASAFDLVERLRASGGRVDLVVADVVMPGMTGPRMVERLRSAGLEAPVLFMSGYPGRLEPGGGDGFMAKPFSRIQLVREVRGILDGARRPFYP